MVLDNGQVTCDCGQIGCDAIVTIIARGADVVIEGGYSKEVEAYDFAVLTPASARALITRLEEAIVIAEGRAKGEEE